MHSGHSMMSADLSRSSADSFMSEAPKNVFHDMIFENGIPIKLEPSQAGIGRANPSEIQMRLDDAGFRAPRRIDLFMSLLRMGRPDFEAHWAGITAAALGQPGVSSSLLSLLAVVGDADQIGAGANAIPPSARERIQQFLTQALSSQLIATTGLGRVDHENVWLGETSPITGESADSQSTWGESGLGLLGSQAKSSLGLDAMARGRAGRLADDATGHDRAAEGTLPNFALDDWNVLVDPRAENADGLLSTRGADLITQFDLTNFSAIERGFARLLEQFDSRGGEVEEELNGFVAVAWIAAALIAVETTRRWYQRNKDRRASGLGRPGMTPVSRSSGSALVTLVGWLAGKSTGLP